MTTDSTKTTTNTKENRRLGITPTQVTASALAAITAAFLGSTLGVAGTVIGAGIASLVSTVGSAIYQQSLDRTGTTLRSRLIALRGVDSSGTADSADAPDSSSAGESAVGGSAVGGSASDGSAAGGPPAGVVGESESGSDGDESATRQPRLARVAPLADRRRRPRWRAAAGLTVLAFVLGMGVVTAVELLHGGPISGGNAGTSVGSLFGESTRHATQSTTTVSPTTTSTIPTTATTTPATTTSPTTTVAPSPTSTPSGSATSTTSATPTTSTSAAATSTP